MSFITAPAPLPGTRQHLSKDFVPTTFEEMYEFYYDFVVANVISQGIERQSAEDVAQAILLKFYQRNSIEYFDAEFVSVHEGVEYKAVFRTFLSGFVLKYVRHHRTMQKKRYEREPYSLNYVAPDTDDEGARMFEENAAIVTGEGARRLAVTFESGYEEAEANVTIAKIRAHLLTLKPINSQDRCDMPAFFDQIQRHAELYGRPVITELAAHFGVSTVSIQTWLKRLRREVSKVI